MRIGLSGLAIAVTVLAWLGTAWQGAAAAVDPARTFLATALHLSAAEVTHLDAGKVVSRTLDVKSDREVATLGVVRIATSPERYVERLTDITSFKRTDGVLQVGTFSEVAQLADVAALGIEDADLKRLRECRVDDCGLRLWAGAIERAQREIDWRAPDASRKAGHLLRQLLVEYVNHYRQGAAAAVEYADRTPRLNLRAEFASLLGADTLLADHAPRLRRHLLDYPASPAGGMTDILYWSKELVRSRPVISITHVAIAAPPGETPVAYAIGSKQIYAMHYFDASLGLTLLVPDRTAASPATYVVYLNRSRIDLFERAFGGIIRRVVAGKARGLVAEQLQRLQRDLADGQSTAEPLRR